MQLNLRFEPTKKQDDAWGYLADDHTTELLFGGGAGGAKSYLGCSWLILQGISLPASRWLLN